MLGGTDRAAISRYETGAYPWGDAASRVMELLEEVADGSRPTPRAGTQAQILARLEELADLVERGFRALGAELDVREAPRSDAGGRKRRPAQGRRTQ